MRTIASPFIKAEHSSELRKALNARSRPDRNTHHPGDLVMYWKAGKGVESGAWHGPAKVLIVEGKNLIWISHLTKLFRCAPEHIRSLQLMRNSRSPSSIETCSICLPGVVVGSSSSKNCHSSRHQLMQSTAVTITIQTPIPKITITLMNPK